jgi:hypothetical protein
LKNFQYVDTSGQMQTVQATDANSAISSATNRAPNSGVMLSQQPTNNFQQPTQTNTQQNLANTPIPSFYAPTPNDGGFKPFEDVDEDAIRRATIQRYQGQIDATKGAYAQLMQQTQLTGQGRLGEGTAQQARGGLLGSDFGQAQMDKTREFNRKGEQDVLLSEAQAIASIMAQAEGDARNDIAQKRAAKQYGHESYKEWLADSENRKKENLRSLALSMLRQGKDPRTMGDQLQQILKKYPYKVTENDIINAYLEQEEGRMGQVGEQFTLSEGQIRFDAQGNPIAAGTPKGSTSGEKLVTINGKTYVQNPDGTFSVPNVPMTNDPALNNIVRAATTVVRDVNDALALMDTNWMFDGNQNILSANARAAAARVAGTGPYEIKQLIDSVKANIGIDTLLNIKREGSGLGQVPQSQLETLQSILGNLNVARDPELLKRDLQEVQKMYDEIIRVAMAESQAGMGGGSDVFAEEW